MDVLTSSLDGRLSIGCANNLGASLTEDGCNFAVYSPDARAVIVCLYTGDTEEMVEEVLLPGKTGHVWHGHIQGIQAGQHYALRVDRGNVELLRSPLDKLLIDPYAKQINRPCFWNERQYSGDSHFMIPKCVVIDDSAHVAPAVAKPAIAARERVIYEAHIKGLTKLHPDVDEAHRGKFLGACHPSIIKHLKQLGVTTVQFMPVASFMPEPYITNKGLTNYWGYNPVNFFAPEPRYAVADALAEMQFMVAEYHRAGLEVIIDVVYNHTAEGGEGGPVLSFKGLCPYQTYLFEQAVSGELVFSNHSGCGNTINTSTPFMFTLILDALRFWLTVVGVDGFRFDLAVGLGREPQHFNPMSGLLRAIQQDPVIKHALLIAEPWDIGPGGYQVGAFSSAWLEVNDKYRDTIRAYWRGDDGITADFATRFMGSRDIFHKGTRSIHTSVNNITYHDGFTMHDLVSYEQRHNLANGENNRDGHGHNLSFNCGVEGETKNWRVLAYRERQKRNLFTTLLLSQGTPHILGGDELSRTQQGNNNAYCQDNEISWYDWELDKRKSDFLAFCQQIIQLRKGSEILSNLQLCDDGYTAFTNLSNIRWYKPDGTDKASADWHATDNRAFAIELRGVPTDVGETEHWLLCFNGSDNDTRFKLPRLSPNGGWQLRIDTRYASVTEMPNVFIQQAFLQAGQSIAIFHYKDKSELTTPAY